MKTKSLTTVCMSILVGFIGLTSCQQSNIKPDASGTFETTEVIVSAEGTGQILDFTVEEGMLLTEGQLVGHQAAAGQAPPACLYGGVEAGRALQG